MLGVSGLHVPCAVGSSSQVWPLAKRQGVSVTHLELHISDMWGFNPYVQHTALSIVVRVCCSVSPAAGGTLIEAMANSGGRLPERQVAIKVALPLLTALEQLHSTGIVHRCAAQRSVAWICSHYVVVSSKVAWLWVGSGCTAAVCSVGTQGCRWRCAVCSASVHPL